MAGYSPIELLCRELASTADATWSAVLPPLSESERELYEWMNEKPNRGDLVYASTGFRRNKPRICVGKLLRTAMEPVYTQSDVDEGAVTEEDLTACTELVWYIETLDGEEVRWVNEVFRRIPGTKWADYKRMKELKKSGWVHPLDRHLSSPDRPSHSQHP